MLSYNNFVDLLHDRKVELYDFQIRISHFRLNKIYDFEMNGGGGKSQKILNKLGKVELENIILQLLNNNIDTAKLLCSKYCNIN